eukprot:5920986-Pyramimonas_sp.AAC.1
MRASSSNQLAGDSAGQHWSSLAPPGVLSRHWILARDSPAYLVCSPLPTYFWQPKQHQPVDAECRMFHTTATELPVVPTSFTELRAGIEIDNFLDVARPPSRDPPPGDRLPGSLRSAGPEIRPGVGARPGN